MRIEHEDFQLLIYYWQVCDKGHLAWNKQFLHSLMHAYLFQDQEKEFLLVLIPFRKAIHSLKYRDQASTLYS